LNSKRAELKALNSPDKELEKLNGLEQKLLKELKSLESVPGSIDLKRRERDMLASRSLIFDGLDEKIFFMQDKITKLEPEHNRYLQSLPLALKVNEYAEECRKLEGIISSMNSNLNVYIQKHEALLSEFEESILNETISQLEELGK